MRLFLVGALLVLSTTVHSLSFSLRQENNIISDCGVTSLLTFHQEGSGEVHLFAGTKRGRIQHFKYSENQIQSLGEIQDELVESKPFPIYSMTGACSDEDNSKRLELFCGGGDRYIAVWQQEEPNKWTCTQRLGPHTGWVKDVLYDHNRYMLHSIGCNCIESWERTEESDLLWTHAAKRSIESSLEEGATLSSDLLCLCSSGDDDCFYAGGVDGRIHVWSCDVAVKDPLYSIGAHNGRINALAYSRTEGLLVSAGHDGNVQCRRVTIGNPLKRIPDAEFSVLDVNGNPVRVTALALLQESSEYVQFVAGTANGEVTCFEAQYKEDALVLSETTKARYHFPDEPMINDICSLKPAKALASSWPLAVGHSIGLSLINVEKDN